MKSLLCQSEITPMHFVQSRNPHGDVTLRDLDPGKTTSLPREDIHPTFVHEIVLSHQCAGLVHIISASNVSLIIPQLAKYSLRIVYRDVLFDLSLHEGGLGPQFPRMSVPSQSMFLVGLTQFPRSPCRIKRASLCPEERRNRA